MNILTFLWKKEFINFAKLIHVGTHSIMATHVCKHNESIRTKYLYKCISGFITVSVCTKSVKYIRKCMYVATCIVNLILYPTLQPIDGLSGITIDRVLSYNPRFFNRGGMTRPAKVIFYSLAGRMVLGAGHCTWIWI